MPDPRASDPAPLLQAPPPLSSAYFALRAARADDRPRLTALAQLQHQLARLMHARDPGVAQVKLAWWRDDLRRGAHGEAQHPVTRTLAPLLADGGLLTGPLGDALAGWDEALQVGRVLDEAALLRHARAVGGPVWRAAAYAVNAPGAIEAASAMGTALRLVEIVALLGLDVRSGRLLIPIDELQAHEIKAHELLAGASATAAARLESDNRYHALMQRQAQRARQRLEASMRDLLEVATATASRRALRPAFVLGRLGLALLDEIEGDRYAVLHQRIALAPLRKWWVALRAR